MKNLHIKKIIINIVVIIIANQTLFGCLNGKPQQRVIQTTQTNRGPKQNNKNNNEEKEIVKLKKDFEEKIAESNIKLDTLNLKQKPETKEEIKKALTAIEDLSKEAIKIQNFFNERPKLKNESKAFNNVKINLNKVEELNQLKKDRIELEKKVKNINKKIELKNKSNKELEEILKNKNKKPKKNNNPNTDTKSNDDIKSNKNNEPVTTKNDKTKLNDDNKTNKNDTLVKTTIDNTIVTKTTKIKTNISNLKIKKNEPKKNNNPNTDTKSNDDIKLNKNNEPVTNKNDKTKLNDDSKTNTNDTLVKTTIDNTIVTNDKKKPKKKKDNDDKTKLNNTQKTLAPDDPKRLLNLHFINPENRSEIIEYTNIKQCNQFVNILKKNKLNVGVVIKHIENVNKKLSDILLLKLNGKTGVHINCGNETKIFNKIDNAALKTLNILDSYSGILQNEKYKEQLNNIENNLDKVKNNLETIYKLHNIKASKPKSVRKDIETTNNQIDNEMRDYITIDALINSKIPTLLLKREELIQQLVNNSKVKNYSNKIDVVFDLDYLDKNKNNKNNKNITEIIKKQIIYIEDFLRFKNYVIENYSNIYKYAMFNNQVFNISEQIKLANNKGNIIYAYNLKQEIIERYKQKKNFGKLYTNILYKDKNTQTTIFNTPDLIIRTAGNNYNNLKNIFEAVISIMNDLFELKTSINNYLTKQTTFKGFIKEYLNKTNTKGENLLNKLLKGFENCISRNKNYKVQLKQELDQIINLTNYLVNQGLEIDEEKINKTKAYKKLKQYVHFYNKKETNKNHISMMIIDHEKFN